MRTVDFITVKVYVSSYLQLIGYIRHVTSDNIISSFTNK